MLKIPGHFARPMPALLLAVLISTSVYAGPSGEAAVKTAFLYNFFKFIEWPESVDQKSYNLCTTLNDQLGDSLLVLENKAIGDKPLLIRREIIGEALKSCHIVFISASENTEAIVSLLKGLPIVTVSDKLGFVGQGGMIGLVQDDNRLSFEINLDLANTDGVHISAKLLKLAKNVNAAK